MALKQDGVHFVFCPEQGMYFRIFFVLSRVSNPQRLTYSPILVEYCPPSPPTLPSRGSRTANAAQNVRAYTIWYLQHSVGDIWTTFNKLFKFIGDRLWVLWWRWCELRKYKSYLKIWSSQCLWVLLCKVSPQQNQFLNQWETTNRIL